MHGLSFIPAARRDALSKRILSSGYSSMTLYGKGQVGAMAKREQIHPTQESAARRRATPEQLWVALAHCYRAMSLLIEHSFSGAGLSLTDFMLLEALLHKGPMTITAIQESVLLASGSMTAAVDRLASRGLIARTLGHKDRRARVLELTKEGRAAIDVAYEQHSTQLKQWMGVLSADERAVTFASLRKLEKQLKNVDPTAPR
jgi:MarR family 2-MHQ and catechol resistance regulon transcriptional repressor